MIWTCIKNFFKSICFYFIPLGVMAFFIIIYLASAIPSSIELIKGTFQTISTKVSSQTFDWNHVSSILMSKFMELYSDPEKAMSLLTDSSQLIKLLKDTVMEAFGVQTLTDEIIALLQNLVMELASKTIVLIVMVVLGFFVGFFLLEIILRRFLTNVNMIEAFLISLLNAILVALVFVLLGYLNLQDSQVAAWIIFVVALFAVIILSLLEAYIFYGIKKVKFLKVLNFKTIITLLLGNLICIALCGGIVALCLMIPNIFTRIFVIVPFLELTLCVLELNAGSYVAKIAGDNKIDKRIEKEVNKQLTVDQ